MNKIEKEKARERGMILQRQWRVEAIGKIAAAHGMEVALQFERKFPVTFDVQIDPVITKMYVYPLYAKFRFFINTN